MNRVLIALLALLVLAVALGILLSGVTAPTAGPDARDRAREDRDANDLARGALTEPTGAIRGRILAAGTGEPVTGAVARAEGAGAQSAVVVRAVAAEDGSFRLSGIPAGEGARLEVGAEGYATVLRDALRIEAGETLDIGEIRLERPVRIAGIVVDYHERPVPDAVVAAMPNRDIMFGMDWPGTLRSITRSERPLDEARTDPDGRFELTHLAAGRYNLRATAVGFAPEIVRDVLAAGGPPGAPVRIVIGPGGMLEGEVLDAGGLPVRGAEVAIDALRSFLDAFQARQSVVTGEDGRFAFSLAEGIYILAARAEGHPVVLRAPLQVPMRGKLRIRLAGSATLAGQIKDASGQGIEGAEIMAFVGMIGWGFELTRSGPDGTYRIPNLPTGPLQFLSVTKDGYAPHPEGPLGERGRPGVSLVAGEETRFDVTLRRGTRVVGRVLMTDGRPIAGASVRVVSGQASLIDPSESITDGEGRYVVAGVGAGRALVLARAPGFSQAVDPRLLGAVMSRRAQMDGASGEIVVIGPNDEEVEVDVVLRSACTVAGKVVDPDGKPVAGARVKLAAPEWARFFAGSLDLTGGSAVQAVSEEDGRFELVGVNAGDDVRLTATATGFAPADSGPLGLEPGQRLQGVELRLAAGGLITGFVRTALGDPVEGALVRVAPSGQEWALVWGSGDPDPVRTDGQGRFEKAVFGTDPVSVRVDAEGYVSRTEPRVEVAPGGRKEDLEIRLEPALFVAGRVLGPDGSPVPGAFVRARFEGQGGPRWEELSALTDDRGEFRIEGLQAGKYTIITQSDLAPEQRLPGVVAGTADVVVRLPAGLRIRGRVVDESGAPVPYVTLRAQRDGGGNARVASDDQGAFVFENLGEGSWTIRYRPEQGDPESFLPEELPSVEAGTASAVLTLRRGLLVEGHVLDVRGAPAGGASVSLTREGDRRSTMAGANGLFRFDGLPEGEWTITATGGGGLAGRLDGVTSGSVGLVVQLEASAAISGRVQDPDGRVPVASLYVFAVPEGSDRAVALSTTAPDGTFVLSGLPPGKYVVRAVDGERNLEAEAAVAAGTAGVTLRLQPKKE